MSRSNAALAPSSPAIDAAESCEIDTDKARLDLALIHDFLVRSHWAAGIPFAVMRRAIDNSLAFGLYRGASQIGFARVVTDHATFAYLADVFVVEAERGKGLGRYLVDTILAHPELQGLRRWLLGTRDAQSLYRRCGFAEPPALFSFLERLDGAVYNGNPLPAEEGRVRVAASQRPTVKPRRRP
jgi:GNAT superfamily N-acetyltransferase